MNSAFWDELGKIAKASGESDRVSDFKLRKRFTALHRYNRRHGAVLNPLNPDIKRIAIPKTKLTEKHLKRLGFKPVFIAIPETGQETIQNYRHPMTNHHLHDHGDRWIMHEDGHTSSTMLAERFKMKEEGEEFIDPILWKGRRKKLRIPKSRLEATLGGAKHLITEGGPGLYGYIKNQLLGGRPMKERVAETTGRARTLVRRMRNFKKSTPEVPEGIASE